MRGADRCAHGTNRDLLRLRRYGDGDMFLPGGPGARIPSREFKSVMLSRQVTTIALLLSLCANASAAVSVRQRDNSALKAYQRVELEVTLDRSYQNPFDPEEISVDAQVTGPDGKHSLVPGFWGQDFPNTFQDPRGI